MSPVDYEKILSDASSSLKGLKEVVIDVVDVKKPDSLQYAVNLSKVISKLSPLIGNMIEYKTVAFLNKEIERTGLAKVGVWERQDPGFPDTIFRGAIEPMPGIEIKTWFPLATEITARFKDSQAHFLQDQTNVAMVAWLPEYVFFGKPKIIDVFVDSALGIAKSRDLHYHKPPAYLIFEPEDTSGRTRNLQQTNTNGFRFQGTASELKDAEEVVRSWGKNCKDYDCGIDYQNKLRDLMGQYKYRSDTNYAKMDRIEHKRLEEFKAKILEVNIHGRTIKEWAKVISKEDRDAFSQLIAVANG